MTKDDAEKIADALDCFWNAAIGESHRRSDSVVSGVVSSIAEGVRAVAERFREFSK